MPKPFHYPLVFGQLRSQVDLDLMQMQWRVENMTRWVAEYDVLNKNDRFLHRTSVFQAAGVRLLAVASTPTIMKVRDSDHTIAIPLHGEIISYTQQGRLQAPEQKAAVFFPKGLRHAEGGNKSTLLISISEQRLRSTANAMLGPQMAPRLAHLLDLETPRLLSLNINGVDYRQVLIQLCGLVDQFSGDEVLLRNFSLDENIVRVALMLLMPEAFERAHDMDMSLRTGNTGDLNIVCNFVRSHIGEPINLTLLESVSGLSARVLQLRVRERFGCSPMQWVKSQRLDVAHQMLQQPDQALSVATVASSCGFSNFSEFSKYYAKRFAELPNITLRRAMAR